LRRTGSPVFDGVKDGSAVLRASEGIDRERAPALWAEANRILRSDRPSRLVLDLSDAKRIDGAGVALVRALEDCCQKSGVAFSVEGAGPAIERFLEFARGRSSERRPQPATKSPSRSAVVWNEATRIASGLREFVEFTGRFAERAAYLATHPHKLRLREAVYSFQNIGADGMWLIVGLSLLLGVIMAFQGISGAQGFGSPIFVADVVTLSTTREMAPLLTGVIVTGRSGAAIAAEIGSMKIHEELDALSVMGFDVVRFLCIPRTLALFVATPLLTLISIGAGIVGGAAVATFYLHLAPVAYFNEVQHAISAAQIVSALVKGCTFGVIIGIIASFEGFSAGKAPEEVGRRTKTAVVRSILAIIFADAFFSIVSEVYGW
jgi:phospholipid/cholesterol/gamma-HCH transport system permease protein